MLLVALLVIPLLSGLLARGLRRLALVEAISLLGSGATLVVAALVVLRVVRQGPLQALNGLLRVDPLSALLIALIAGIGFAAALVSLGYLRHDLAARLVPDGRLGVRWYYLGFHVFIATMLATVSVDNLGLLWVGLEATTLVSALLVGFYRTRDALEATWKYLILCTVGIIFALFGVLITYYAAVQVGGAGIASLNWTALSRQAGLLDPALLRLAFVFILLGFGTKAAFAPLHTWIADAHSQAPTPISALLSGVLLTCAVYGILRFHVITAGATGTSFSSNLLLGFGLLSVAISVPFIIVQRDLKRLLAYSSVEHIGLVAVAFGIGGPLGVYAGVLHLINHAVTKAMLFFVVGDLVQRFGTRRISAIRGALRLAPLAGWLLIFGVLAITGLPPFSIFASELTIAAAGFAGGTMTAAAATLVVLLLGAIFAGLLAHTVRMVYSAPADDRAAAGRGRRLALPTALAVIPLAGVMLVLGVVMPSGVHDLLQQVSHVLTPAGEVARR